MLRHLHRQLSIAPLPTPDLLAVAESFIDRLPERSLSAARIYAIQEEQRTIIALRDAVERFGAQPALLAVFNRDGALSKILPAIPATEALTCDTAIDAKALLVALDRHPLVVAEESWRTLARDILAVAIVLAGLSSIVVGWIPALVAMMALTSLRQAIPRDYVTTILRRRDLAALIDAIDESAAVLTAAPKMAPPTTVAEAHAYVNKLQMVLRPARTLGIELVGHGLESELVLSELPVIPNIPFADLGYGDGDMRQLSTAARTAFMHLKNATPLSEAALKSLGHTVDTFHLSNASQEDKRAVMTAVNLLEDTMTTLTTRITRASRLATHQLQKLSRHYTRERDR